MQYRLKRTVVAAAILAAYANVYADDNEDLRNLTTPGSQVSVGVAATSQDARRSGLYNGLSGEGSFGLLNIDVNRRNDATGEWFKLKGSNLGLDNRELRISQELQGNWGYYLDYSEIPRAEPMTVYTSVTGVGSATLAEPAKSTPSLVATDLKLKREALTLGYTKVLGGGFDVQVRARNEEKNGARIWSIGNFTPAFEFAPEPVHATMRQLDVILGYSSPDLNLQTAYYGSQYDNHNTALTVIGGNAGLAGFSPIGLPPDNQAHQLSFSGGYAITPKIRSTFKLAYTRATQEDTFISGVTTAPGINPNGNLGGRVDTTLMQFGISARPLPKVSVVADVRREDRDDKTPVRVYTTAGVSPTSSYSGENLPVSITSTTGKLEAVYRLSGEGKVTTGIDYVEKARNTLPVRAVSFREKTNETSYRIAFDRPLWETVSGGVMLVRSFRDGSPFLSNVLNCGTVVCGTSSALNLIAPLNLADRDREKIRLSLNWTPNETLSWQLLAEQTRDDYQSRTVDNYGLRNGSATNVSLDGTYTFNDRWQGNAWISRNLTVAERADRNSASNPWASTVSNRGTSLGLGVRGKPTEKVEVGMNLSHSDTTDAYQQYALAGPAVTSLPDVYTRQSTMKLFAAYTLDKNASVRIDYMYDRFATNDWTWSSWVYSDGTRLTQASRQNVNFIGVSYSYRF